MSDIAILKKALIDLLFCELDAILTPHDKLFYSKEFRKILNDLYKIKDDEDDT